MKMLKSISVNEFIDILVKSNLEEKEQPKFYLDTDGRFEEITEVDLIDGRITTIDDNFTDINWELEKENIYIQEG